MSYLRHALNLFLLLTVLALAVPSSTLQDNTKSDDATSQSDRSDDQQSDQVALGDIIFEHAAIFCEQLPGENYFEIISTASENPFPSQTASDHSFLPHLFISGGGLMPRAPALG